MHSIDHRKEENMFVNKYDLFDTRKELNKLTDLSVFAAVYLHSTIDKRRGTSYHTPANEILGRPIMCSHRDVYGDMYVLCLVQK